MGTVVGPKVGEALKSLTGNKAAIQGVDYPADAAGNAALGGSGGPKMASLVETALKQCPDTKVVLGGYSQGAMVVHSAASKLSSGQVAGAVTFGDPFKSQKPDNIDQFKTFCATGDPVCLNGGNVMAHLSYGADAQTAAQFLVSAAGL
ncbi:cutinase [Aspergillus falconensis]